MDSVSMRKMAQPSFLGTGAGTLFTTEKAHIVAVLCEAYVSYDSMWLKIQNETLPAGALRLFHI